MPTHSDILARVPIFSLLETEALAALAEQVDELREPAGKKLFHTGDPGDAMYVVLEGEVELFFKNATGDRILLEKAGPGDFFGEMSLLDGGARNASALVTQPIHALMVDREDLDARSIDL